MQNNMEIKYKDDTRIVYECGCAEGRLEYPEYWIKRCDKHELEQLIPDPDYS